MKRIIVIRTIVTLFFWLVTCTVCAASIQLSQEEQAWLKENKTIRVSGPQAFPPFQYFDNDGTFKGMASDYIFYIANMVGLQVEVVKKLPWPEMVSILDKGLAAISQEKHNEIRQRWIAVRYEHGISTKDIVKWVLLVYSIATILLSIFYFWNRKLSQLFLTLDLKKEK